MELPCRSQLAPDASDVLRLPLGAWARVTALSGEQAGPPGEGQGGLLVQAGALLAPGLRRSAAVLYSGAGDLERLALLREARAENRR